MAGNSYSQPYSVPTQQTSTMHNPTQDYGTQASGYQKPYSMNNQYNEKSNKYKAGTSKDSYNSNQPSHSVSSNYKCFTCGQPGHLRRLCPQQRQPTDPLTKNVSDLKLKVVTWKTARPDTYMEVEICGCKYKCFLDTGCDHSIMPQRLIPTAPIQPASVRVTAANGRTLPF